MTSRTVLHLAAPVQISGANPLFSSVLLAPTGQDDVGRWELREWFRDRGRADVLSLPDGSTFGGARVGAEAEMDALAWAAAAAGISTIVLGRDTPDAYATDAVFASIHESLGKSSRPPTLCARRSRRPDWPRVTPRPSGPELALSAEVAEQFAFTPARSQLLRGQPQVSSQTCG